MATTSSTPVKETVYGGPPVETVYSGPTPAAAKNAVAGTVYDPAKHKPNQADYSVTRKAVTKKIQYASVRFFVVAAISLAEYFIYRGADQDLTAYSALFTATVFMVIGLFAIRLSRGAFLAGLLLYGLDTLGLVYTGLTSDLGIFFVAKPLIVHGIILYRLYASYQLIGDLHDLEAG